MKNHKIIKEINKSLKRKLISIALNLAHENNFIDKEIEAYEEFFKEYKSQYKDAVETAKNYGLLKKALEFHEKYPLEENEQKIEKVKQDIVSNNSEKIAKKILPESNMYLFKLIYAGKETGNYSEISDILNDKFLITVKPFFTDLYCRIHSKN